MLINAAVSVGLFCEAALVVLILQRKAVSAYPLLFFTRLHNSLPTSPKLCF